MKEILLVVSVQPENIEGEAGRLTSVTEGGEEGALEEGEMT